MTVTADQVSATLALLIPGFVALKIFYWLGHRSKRADWEWVLWSLLVSAPIAAGATWMASQIGEKPTDLPKAFADCGLTASVGKSGEDLRSALNACASNALANQNADLRLGIALTLAVVGGLAIVVGWNLLTKRVSRLRERASLEAWDAILSQPHWVQMKVGDLIYSGKVDVIADPVETDSLDIYIREPALIKGGVATALTATEGVLVARDKIDWIQVLNASQGSTT